MSICGGDRGLPGRRSIEEIGGARTSNGRDRKSMNNGLVRNGARTQKRQAMQFKSTADITGNLEELTDKRYIDKSLTWHKTFACRKRSWAKGAPSFGSGPAFPRWDQGKLPV